MGMAVRSNPRLKAAWEHGSSQRERGACVSWVMREWHLGRRGGSEPQDRDSSPGVEGGARGAWVRGTEGSEEKEVLQQRGSQTQPEGLLRDVTRGGWTGDWGQAVKCHLPHSEWGQPLNDSSSRREKQQSFQRREGTLVSPPTTSASSSATHLLSEPRSPALHPSPLSSRTPGLFVSRTIDGVLAWSALDLIFP